MYDMSVPNSKPGICAKCNGSGEYRWGTINNGRASHTGVCWSCKGTGKQTQSDIHRNVAYNRHKMRSISAL